MHKSSTNIDVGPEAVEGRLRIPGAIAYLADSGRTHEACTDGFGDARGRSLRNESTARVGDRVSEHTGKLRET